VKPRKRICCEAAKHGDRWVQQLLPASPGYVAVYWAERDDKAEVWTEPVIAWALLEADASRREHDQHDDRPVVAQRMMGITLGFWKDMSPGWLETAWSHPGDCDDPRHQGLLGYEPCGVDLSLYQEEANERLRGLNEWREEMRKKRAGDGT
jgi:hypothetical protein